MSVDNCFTRLRVRTHHPERIDETLLKSTGASGFVRNGDEIQVVYGLKVNQIRANVDTWLSHH